MTRTHTPERAGGLIPIRRAGIAKFIEACEWAKENVSECLNDCGEDGKITVSLPDGFETRVHCPILSRECALGRSYLARIRRLAIETLPKDIPTRFRNAGLDVADETLAISQARLWDGTATLYIYGPTGTGKSFAAAWWVYNDFLRRLDEHWMSPWKWTELSTGGVKWFSAFAVCLERANLYEAQGAGFLVLDDLGCEVSTPANKAILNELIAVRYNEKRPTIITSNCDLCELEKRYMSRMYERITQDGIIADAGLTNKRLH